MNRHARNNKPQPTRRNSTMTNEAATTENLVNKTAVAAGVIPAPEQGASKTKKATKKGSKPAAKKDAKPASKKASKAAAPKKEAKPAAKKDAKPAAAKKTPKAKDAATPREGSKKQIVLDLLRRKDGATMAEIAKATDWQNHSIRGFISGNLTKKMGLVVESTKNAAGERTYHIAASK
jgi:hypothetical protein